jgi:Tn3 transposase DDE domain
LAGLSRRSTCCAISTTKPIAAVFSPSSTEGKAGTSWPVLSSHGKRGELRQRYREGQEDQLGALGLVVNAVILWNTIYMDAALGELRAGGFDVRDKDVDRLSPLGHGHLNVLGRYAFTLPEFVARGELRP